MSHVLKLTDILFIVVLWLSGFFLGKNCGMSVNSSDSLESAPSQALSLPSSASGKNSVSFKRTITEVRNSSEKISPKLDAIIQKFLKGETPNNWEEELARILEYSLTEQGIYETLLLFFVKWSEVDFVEALKWAGKINIEPSSLHSEIFAQLASKDAKIAMAHYENNAELINDKYRDILAVIAGHWAIQNPEEALEKFLHVESKSDRNALIYHFITAIGYQTARTREYIDYIYDKNGSIPSQVIREWAAAAPEEMLKWGNTINRDRQPYYIESVLEGIAMNDVKKGMEVFNELSLEDRLRYSHLVSKHIEDPREALTWVLEITPPSKLDEISLLRINDWAAKDPEEARKWIMDLQPSTAKDMAIERYVQNIYDPESYEPLLDLIELIPDREKKNEILRAALEMWEQEDPDKFQARFQNSGNS